MLGLCLAIATALFWAQHRDKLRRTLGFNVALYAGGAVIVAAIVFAFSLADDWLPDDWMFWQVARGFVTGAAVLGGLRRVAPRQRRVLDVVCVMALLLPLVVGLAV